MVLSQPDYDVIVMEDVLIPMRDGIQLAADIYRPAQKGDFVREPLPVILERTPYNKRSPDRVDRGPRYFAQHGYIREATCYHPALKLTKHQRFVPMILMTFGIIRWHW